MTIYFPWGILAIVISLYFFYNYNRIRKEKRDERREEFKERRQALLDQTLKAKRKSEEQPRK